VTTPAELSPFVRRLQRSADLVDAWGGAVVPGRSTLRQLFAFQGQSVWDVLAADLALYRIAPALEQPRPARARFSRLRRQLRAVRHLASGSPRRDESDCTRWPTGPVALFLGFTPYIARDILLPVVAAMGDRQKLRPVFLTRDLIRRETKDVGALHSIWRHWAGDVENDARGIAQTVRKAFRVLANDPAYQGVFAEEGRELWTDAGEAILDMGLYASDEVANYVASARHILSNHPPAVIVSPDVADPRTRAFTLLGAAVGIPTVEIQFGACGPEAVEWRFCAADQVAVWGPQSRDVLVKHKVPPERICITGSPRHDALFGVTDTEMKAFRDRFRVPPGNLAVVFGSVYSMKAYKNAPHVALLREMKEAIFAAAASLPMLTLIVKPHPLEDVEETAALALGAKNIIFADRTEDIRTLTRTCDAFVTFGSASTLDAIVLGKPTICPAFSGWRWSELFVNTGAVAVPHTADEVRATLGQLAEDRGLSIVDHHARARDIFLSEWVRDGGRGGTTRVVALLERVARLK
jgi:CDP-Glycerol:Poly(glycerophosphate) glycerophosphotransferase